MKSVLGFFIISAFVVIASEGLSQEKRTAENLYQEGLTQMEGKGDYKKAVEIFSQILKGFPDNRPVSAKAQFQIGVCYERLGETEAQKAYERVVKHFADQIEVVAEALERLALLRRQNEEAGQMVKLSFGDRVILSNALSPDGSQMAVTEFQSGGQNIATYNFGKNEMKQVTRFPWEEGWTLNPIWSADGRELAFIKGGYRDTDSTSLWVSTAEGTLRLLYTKPGPTIVPCAWLPDASGILVLLRDKAENVLGIVGRNGGSLRVVRRFADKDVGHASLSPDGRFVAFAVGKLGQRDIRVADMRGEDIGVLADNPADDAAPRWSPDGEHVVFLSKRHGSWALWGVSVKKGLPDGPPFMIVAGMEDCSLLNWSPAGLAVNRNVTMFDIFTMQVDPTTARPLSKPKQLEYTPTGFNFSPIWSPDGGPMAFVCRRRDEGRAPYVVIMPREGGHTREFKVPYEFSHPRWTPDASALGFVASDTLGKQALFRLTLKSGIWEQWPTDIATWTTSEWSGDGGSYYYAIQGFASSDPGIVRRAVGRDGKTYVYRPLKGQGTAFRHLRRSPDNKWLAFEEDSRRIIAVNLETGTSHTIIPQVEDTSKWIVKEGFGIPAWSSDSRHLLVVKTMTDDKTLKQHHELYVVGLFEGVSEKIDIYQSLPQDGRIVSMDWSPDGKEVAFEVDSAVFETHLMRTVIPKERR